MDIAFASVTGIEGGSNPNVIPFTMTVTFIRTQVASSRFTLNTGFEVPVGATTHDIEKTLMDYVIADGANNPDSNGGPFILTPHTVYFTSIDRG